MRGAVGEGRERGHQLGAVVGDDDRAAGAETAAGEHRGGRDDVVVGRGFGVGAQPGGLGAEGGVGVGVQRPDHRPGGGRRRRCGGHRRGQRGFGLGVGPQLRGVGAECGVGMGVQRPGGGRRRLFGGHRLSLGVGPQLRGAGEECGAGVGVQPARRRLVSGRGLQHHVRVGAADAEARHRGAARAVVAGPRLGLREHLDPAARPVHVRARHVGVQGARDHVVPQGLDHLDHARDAGRGLRVADVGLEGTEPQRRFAVLPVGGQQRVCLDRVAQRGAGAVCLHDVDVLSGQSGGAECAADDLLLRLAVRGGEAVAGTVGAGRAAAQQRQDRVAVAAGVGQAFQHEHARALGEGGAVGVGGERLRAAVGGKAVLAGEVHEVAGRGHHGDAAGERERAVAAVQCVGGQLDRDQRRRARGVDGERGPAQPVGVGDPARRDTRRGAGQEVAVDQAGRLVQPGAVVHGHRADEHAGVGPATAHPARARRARSPPRLISSISRCCGSMASASRGLSPKNAASKVSASCRKPPMRVAHGRAARVEQRVQIPAAVRRAAA